MSAGIVPRFVAVLVDGIIVSIPTGLAAFMFESRGAYSAIGFVVGFLYYGYFWSKNGQSPGKKIMNLRVVTRDGGYLTFVAAGLRGTVGYYISGVFLGLGFLWAAFDANHETWHDKIFGSRVEMAELA